MHSPDQPLEAFGLETHRASRVVDADLRGGAVTEEVAVLPLARDSRVLQGFEPGTQDQLAQGLRRPELGPAFARALPLRGQQADDGFAPLVGLPQSPFPALSRCNARIAIEIKEDLLSESRLLFDEPTLQRDGLRRVPTGVTQEDARHRTAPERMTTIENATTSRIGPPREGRAGSNTFDDTLAAGPWTDLDIRGPRRPRLASARTFETDIDQRGETASAKGFGLAREPDRAAGKPALRRDSVRRARPPRGPGRAWSARPR
jgi:hypothetical protein